jgi:hypothetical protein
MAWRTLEERMKAAAERKARRKILEQRSDASLFRAAEKEARRARLSLADLLVQFRFPEDIDEETKRRALQVAVLCARDKRKLSRCEAITGSPSGEIDQAAE